MEVRGWWRGVFAPKGPQHNSPGHRPGSACGITFWQPGTGETIPNTPATFCFALSGFDHCIACLPRALPWADMLGPFGATLASHPLFVLFFLRKETPQEVPTNSAQQQPARTRNHEMRKMTFGNQVAVRHNVGLRFRNVDESKVFVPNPAKSIDTNQKKLRPDNVDRKPKQKDHPRKKQQHLEAARMIIVVPPSERILDATIRVIVIVFHRITPRFSWSPTRHHAPIIPSEAREGKSTRQPVAFSQHLVKQHQSPIISPLENIAA